MDSYQNYQEKIEGRAHPTNGSEMPGMPQGSLLLEKDKIIILLIMHHINSLLISCHLCVWRNTVINDDTHFLRAQ